MQTVFPLSPHGSQIAFLDADTSATVTYADLQHYQNHFQEIFQERSLLFLFCHNTLDEVITYFSALNCGQVICLLDARLDDALKKHLIATYTPRWIVQTENTSWSDYQPLAAPLKNICLWKTEKEQPPLHPELTLLLSTSGTTGSPKMIRLSTENILSNARSIIEYLGIGPQEKAMASLPMHYSYGLSVLHTHLLAGATTVLTQHSVLQEEFWKVMRDAGCTSFAGVPYTYVMLDRIGFQDRELPQLKTMTQAGGHLDRDLVLKFWRKMQSRGGRFFVMYGQTEATARIAYLPPERLPEKAGAIGQAIPGGNLDVVDGELVYRGPNVMLGYAEHREDLSKGDLMQGKLHTGDLGYRDSDGIFYVTGRLKRISKIYGYRINLDEIEEVLRPISRVAATSDDQSIDLFFENGSDALYQQCIQLLSEKYKLHYTTFKCRNVSSLPRTPSGKIDYKRLG